MDEIKYSVNRGRPSGDEVGPGHGTLGGIGGSQPAECAILHEPCGVGHQSPLAEALHQTGVHAVHTQDYEPFAGYGSPASAACIERRQGRRGHCGPFKEFSSVHSGLPSMYPGGSRPRVFSTVGAMSMMDGSSEEWRQLVKSTPFTSSLWWQWSPFQCFSLG